MNIVLTDSSGRTIEIPDIAQVVCRMSNGKSFLAVIQPMMSQETTIQLAASGPGFQSVQMANDGRSHSSHPIETILSQAKK